MYCPFVWHSSRTKISTSSKFAMKLLVHFGELLTANNNRVKLCCCFLTAHHHSQLPTCLNHNLQSHSYNFLDTVLRQDHHRNPNTNTSLVILTICSESQPPVSTFFLKQISGRSRGAPRGSNFGATCNRPAGTCPHCEEEGGDALAHGLLLYTTPYAHTHMMKTLMVSSVQPFKMLNHFLLPDFKWQIFQPCVKTIRMIHWQIPFGKDWTEIFLAGRNFQIKRH